VQTTRASASTDIAPLSRASTPRPANTVSTPKTNGIAAATSERKTSSRIRIRSGAASSSARSVASSDSCCSARERLAYPDWVAVNGGATWAASRRSRLGTTSSIARASGTW
jgi:hypothetical protein